MYKLYKTESPFGYTHREDIVELTDEQKKEIRFLLKELFNYCTIHRIKDGVSWKEMALYQYVRGFGLFCGGCSLRESTFLQYSWSRNNHSYVRDKNIIEYYKKLKEIMGADAYELFWMELNKRMIANFKVSY